MAARTDGDTPSTDRPARAQPGREAALEALLAEIRACRICAPHLAHEPRPVLQAGPRAPILLVGQAPGRRVHETGLPFNDPSGDRLRRWLGVTRAEFYDPRFFNIVPMGFCWPGTVKGKGDLPPRPECAATWRRRLIAALPEPELVLLVGRYAIAWHLGEEALADGVSGAVAQHRLVPAPSLVRGRGGAGARRARGGDPRPRRRQAARSRFRLTARIPVVNHIVGVLRP